MSSLAIVFLLGKLLLSLLVVLLTFVFVSSGDVFVGIGVFFLVILLWLLMSFLYQRIVVINVVVMFVIMNVLVPLTLL